MKKIKFLITALIIIATFSLNSCGPDEALDGFVEDSSNPDSNNPDTPATVGLFTVDFKGNTWTATKIEAAIYNNTITILAEKSNGESFVIGVIDGAISGMYPANINEAGYIPAGSEIGYWSVNNENQEENTGSIIVSSINTSKKTISGTFYFKGYWDDGSKVPIDFTKGVFTDIPYTTENPVTGGGTVGGTSAFYAKLDGTEFVENTTNVAYLEASGVNPYYSIVGNKTNGDNIGIKIETSLPVGTHQITDTFESQVKISSIINDVLYNSESGSVTITSKTSTHITGTFNAVVKNFTTGNTKTITAGTFSVDLP